MLGGIQALRFSPIFRDFTSLDHACGVDVRFIFHSCARPCILVSWTERVLCRVEGNHMLKACTADDTHQSCRQTIHVGLAVVARSGPDFDFDSFKAKQTKIGTNFNTFV